MDTQFRKSNNIFAMTVLEEFFGYYGPDRALHYAERLIYYAVHSNYYRDSEPYAIVFHAEWLRKVVAAVFVLDRAFWFRNDFAVKPGKEGLPDLDRRHEFAGNLAGMEWACLPRHVTAKQYLNPLKALEKFCAYKSEPQWLKAIDELLEYSLCRASITGCEPPYNIMKLRIRLLQVMEACHLMVVRYALFKKNQKATGTEYQKPTGETSLLTQS